MRTFRHSLSLGLALGLSLSLACTDTLTDPVDSASPVDGPSFGKAPAESGVVERITVINGFIVSDRDAGLVSTIGFDRVRWCDDGAPENLFPYLTAHEVQLTRHADGRVTSVRRLEGILVVSEGGLFNCNRPLLGVGTGTLERTIVLTPGGPPSEPTEPPRVRKASWHGFITTIADGSTKRVNVLRTRWEGFRNDEFFDVATGKIVLR